MGSMKSGVLFTIVLVVPAILVGCTTPEEHRRDADEVAYEIMDREQERLFGRTEPLRIETPADTLRRRLLLDQELPHSGAASMSSRLVDPIDQWPDRKYFESPDGSGPVPWSAQEPLVLSLLDALQIAARNSREFQRQKELVFQAALALDLEADLFRQTWSGMLASGVIWDESTEPRATRGSESSATTGVTRRTENGALITANIALDVAKLLGGSDNSSTGIFGDFSIAIPLLRGSDEFVVTEPLQQADRNVVYAMYDLERFKRVLAVQVATQYYGVLQSFREALTAEENYRFLLGATRRARRQADAMRMPEIEVDQTRQDELQARDSWIESVQSYETSLDLLKQTLGLPVDAEITLDLNELEALAEAIAYEPPEEGPPERVAADAPVDLMPPGREGGGPLEMEPWEAIVLALRNRLDLRVALGRVFDAQRIVAVAADTLRADMTLFGSAAVGARRALADADLERGEPAIGEGVYSIFLTLDLPLERTAERNLYRNSLINFEQIVRDLQRLEDFVKFEVRQQLRTLMEARERLHIQLQSLRLAERRVDSTTRLLERDRADSRDVLESQFDLVDAKDKYYTELIRYRIAELSLQRDLGLLMIDGQGLWTEFEPGTGADDEAGAETETGDPDENGTEGEGDDEGDPEGEKP